MTEFTEHGDNTDDEKRISGDLKATSSPNPKVEAKGPSHCDGTASYELRKLAQAEALVGKEGRELGAFFRKVRIISFCLSQWRRQKAQGLISRARAGWEWQGQGGTWQRMSPVQAFSVRKSCEALTLAPGALYRLRAQSGGTATRYQQKSSVVQQPELLCTTPNQL